MKIYSPPPNYHLKLLQSLRTRYKFQALSINSMVNICNDRLAQSGKFHNDTKSKPRLGTNQPHISGQEDGKAKALTSPFTSVTFRG
jgi:hypothetical protein